MRALLLLVLLTSACFAHGQTRIWVETGFNRHSTLAPEYQVSANGNFYDKQKFNYTSPTLGVRIEQYINYNFAIVTGATAWNYELNSGRKQYAVQDHVLIPKGYYTQDYTNYQPKSTWRTTYVNIPIGISFSPQGRVFGIAAGVDVNVVMKSTMNDMADTLNARYSYNATHAVNRINTAPFVSLTFKWRSFAFSAKYFSFSKSLVSENVLTGAMNNAQDKNAHIAPLYYSLYRTGDLRVHGINLTIGYRIY
ncbi:MAG: hypothetical protein WDO14_14200 [Bacteroidota bacterium]